MEAIKAINQRSPPNLWAICVVCANASKPNAVGNAWLYTEVTSRFMEEWRTFVARLIF